MGIQKLYDIKITNKEYGLIKRQRIYQFEVLESDGDGDVILRRFFYRNGIWHYDYCKVYAIDNARDLYRKLIKQGYTTRAELV